MGTCLVVNSAPYGMAVSDTEGRIVMVNPKAEEMFGSCRFITENAQRVATERAIVFPCSRIHSSRGFVSPSAL